MLAITSIIVAIMHALLTRRVYLAFFRFTFYDFSLWLEKLAEKYKISRVLLPPASVAPRARAEKFHRITYLDEHGP